MSGAQEVRTPAQAREHPLGEGLRVQITEFRSVFEIGGFPLTGREAERLLEYSRSLPTGTQEGKMWRRNVDRSRPGLYLIGRYGAPKAGDPPNSVSIEWRAEIACGMLLQFIEPVSAREDFRPFWRVSRGLRSCSAPRAWLAHAGLVAAEQAAWGPA